MKHLFLLTFLGFFIISFTSAKIKPTQLTCEYLENPTVVDVEKPRLAWINIAGEGERGQYQSAYQVRVASSKDKLGNTDLWDSKKVESNESATLPTYDGASRNEFKK